MYISICEVLDKRLKEAVAERHGHRGRPPLAQYGNQSHQREDRSA